MEEEEGRALIEAHGHRLGTSGVGEMETKGGPSIHLSRPAYRHIPECFG